MGRLFIYTKDVQLLTGRGRTTAEKLITAIKQKFNKTRTEAITVEEFCAHTGLQLSLVLNQLR